MGFWILYIVAFLLGCYYFRLGNKNLKRAESIFETPSILFLILILAPAINIFVSLFTMCMYYVVGEEIGYKKSRERFKSKRLDKLFKKE